MTPESLYFCTPTKSASMKRGIILWTILIAANSLRAQLKTEYLTPVRIVWQQGTVSNSQQILKPGNGQADLNNTSICVLKNTTTEKSSILLDFGKELQGGLEIVTGRWGGANIPRNIHIRYGESVSEAMSEIGEKGATNDHAIRDFNALLPWLGRAQFGESGFRFVRIDFLDPNAELHLKEVRAISRYRDIKYAGSFKSSDERLNRIWQTGAYTVHLNMQDYLWDGVKRDRLVWVGDMHPEISTINAVFGYNEVVPKTLDLIRDKTPLPDWMNGISTYSMWWIIIHRDWYLHNGNLNYLKEQKLYLAGLVKQITTHINASGRETMDGNRFLDWPSSEDTAAIHAGLQALTILSLEAASELGEALKDKDITTTANQSIALLKKHIPVNTGSKQGTALLSLAGIIPAAQAEKDILSVGGGKNFSTFYGYYILQAMAKAGNYEGAMSIIRNYWGAMLDLGATTFWEDFNLDWLPEAARIDEPVPAGKKDIHGDYGDYCYKGFRHSLCHGWASGPTAWLTQHVLGVNVTGAGCSVLTIDPHLGDLSFVEGTFPTPKGTVYIKHRKAANGKVVSDVKGPKDIKIILK
jgi:alpha-L-rhamnosidase